MDPHRKSWNQGQQALRSALSQPADDSKIVEIFLSQHAMLHSAKIVDSVQYSFDDDLWLGLREGFARCIPPRGEHSILWMILHKARIEDMTMNVLLAGEEQLFLSDYWLERMKITTRHNFVHLNEASAVKSKLNKSTGKLK
jgi:hypothetical protein